MKCVFSSSSLCRHIIASGVHHKLIERPKACPPPWCSMIAAPLQKGCGRRRLVHCEHLPLSPSYSTKGVYSMSHPAPSLSSGISMSSMCLTLYHSCTHHSHQHQNGSQSPHDHTWILLGKKDCEGDSSGWGCLLIRTRVYFTLSALSGRVVPPPFHFVVADVNTPLNCLHSLNA